MEAQYQVVLTQNGTYMRVLIITFLCPRVIGEFVHLAMTNFSVVNFFLFNIKRVIDQIDHGVR